VLALALLDFALVDFERPPAALRARLCDRCFELLVRFALELEVVEEPVLARSGVCFSLCPPRSSSFAPSFLPMSFLATPAAAVVARPTATPAATLFLIEPLEPPEPPSSCSSAPMSDLPFKRWFTGLFPPGGLGKRRTRVLRAQRAGIWL
jgi:hypothetical protein